MPSYWTSDKANELWIEILSATVCILSIFGSLAIILTFAFVKAIRSKARELIVHLSVMDLMYSTANLVGLWLPYHEHLITNHTNTSTYSTYHGVCEAQAFLAVYGTIGSVLWTLGLAVYLYYRIVSRDKVVTKRIVVVLYVLCYSLPLYATLWLLTRKGLGYSDSPLSGGGWCSISDNIDPLENFMTYDIWIWLDIIILIPLYFLVHIHISEEIRRYNRNSEYHILVAISNPAKVKTEIKLLFIPVVFIFLRVWDVMDSIMFLYHPSPVFKSNYHWLKPLTAIGDCGQGFCNFIIFFVFQPQLRQLLINGCRCFCCICFSKASQWWRELHSKRDTPHESDELVQPNRASPVSTQFSQYTLYV